MNALKRWIRQMIPPILFNPLLSAYHFALAWIAALFYGFPSRKILTVAVTGTKGKSSLIEYLNAIFAAAGYETAVASGIRFKIGTQSVPNETRMTMIGRFRLQRFLRDAVLAGCGVALIEMTSEGARQHRHRFVDLDALVFTNLAPEHIESHGSLQAYKEAKFSIGTQLLGSRKRPRFMAANAGDPEGARYLTLPVEYPLPFSLESTPWHADENGGVFRFEGAEISVSLPGDFSIQNALAAATLTRALGIPLETIIRGIGSLKQIPGRAERIDAGQNFLVVVDYAHTPDSLSALYRAFQSRKKICVLGATGGGRDTWKRPAMGAIAAKECASIILTNEDPYDEDPRSIVDMIARGMGEAPREIIMDRREAIRRAIALAKEGDAVLITGKGTDPSICGPRGTSEPWSDATVAREELQRFLSLRESR